MDNRRFWRLVVVRAVWFMVAVVVTMLGIVLLLQTFAGASRPSGSDYATTVIAKTPVSATQDGTLCRVAVDPAGAPDASDAPTRIRSVTACDSLPAVGSQLPLTYLSDGTTVVTTDVAPQGERGSIVPALVVFAAALLCWGLFVRQSRRFSQAVATEP